MAREVDAVIAKKAVPRVQRASRLSTRFSDGRCRLSTICPDLVPDQRGGAAEGATLITQGLRAFHGHRDSRFNEIVMNTTEDPGQGRTGKSRVQSRER